MISIIIPVSNDVSRLRQTLRSLVPEKAGHEVIVVDGGSRDGGLELARSVSWARCLKVPGTPGARVNAGAAAANGDLLLILLPGTVLERGWAAAVEEAAGAEGFALGAFRTRMDSRIPVYRFGEALAAIRSRVFGLPREEQAIFLRKDRLLHTRLYLDLEAARDFNLARRLRREGRFTLLPLAAVRPALPLHSLPMNGLCRAATFWAFIFNRPLSAIDRCEATRTPQIVVLVEAPEPGRTPGWLRRAVGEERALRLYTRSVEAVLQAALKVAPDRVLGFYRPSRAREAVAGQWGPRVHWLAQSGRGKAERHLGALREAAASSRRPVLLLDPLCPGLTPAAVRKAIRGLEQSDAVIGPNGCGGCYLVGLRPAHLDGLEDLSWRRPVREEELAGALLAMGKRCRRLAPVRTLDGPEDLTYYWARGWMEGQAGV